MNASSSSKTRILVGASSYADAKAALQILHQLALDLVASIGGLFVEESETFTICQMPNQRIVAVSGDLVIAPNPTQLRTLIEADAKAFRESLEQVAEPAGVGWTFEQTIGDLIHKALQASAGWDIVVFGHRNIHSVGGKVVAFAPPAPGTIDLIEFSSKIAERLSTDRLVITTGQHPDVLAGTTAFPSFQDALAALARTNAEVVLLDVANGPIHTLDELRQVLDVSRCPVFVFGVSAICSELEHNLHIPPSRSPE